MRYFRSPDSYEHGSRSRYRLGCRCEPCGEANRAYAQRRALERAKGRENPLIDAGQVRAYLQQLEAKGVTPNRVGKLANVSWVQLYRIKSGQQQMIRKLTAESVLAVTPTAHDAFALIPSYHTRQLLDGLYAEDYQKQQIADKLHLRHRAVRVQTKRTTVKHALQVRGLYRWLMGEE